MDDEQREARFLKYFPDGVKLYYKGYNHLDIADLYDKDPDEVLCQMAQWPIGKDDEGNPLNPAAQDDELYDFILYFWNLKFPRTCSKDCSSCSPPFRILADSFFARYPLIIAKASRGSAKSAMQTTLSLTEAVNLVTSVDVLGASEKQSQVVMDYMNNVDPRTKGCWWDSPRAPLGLRDPKEDLVASQTLVHGGRVCALTASHRTVRGRRPTRLRIDELDEAEVALIKSAQGCPQGDGRRGIKKNILMTSTHQHTDGAMTFYLEMAKERNARAAREGKGVVIPVHKYCYRDILTTNGGFLDPQEIAEAKAMIPDDTWEFEFENAEPNTTGRIFKDHQLDFLFDKEWKPNGQDYTCLGDPDTPLEIPPQDCYPEFQEVKLGQTGLQRRQRRVENHLEFYAGADFANDIDWSVFDRIVGNSLDENGTLFHCGWYRTARRDTIKEIVHEYNDFVNFHDNTMAFHDETGNKMINDEIDCESEGYTFTRVSKKELLDNMIVMVQNKQIKGPYIDYAYREFKYFTRDHVNGKKHLPDTVASFALACYAVAQSERGSFLCEVVEA